VAPEKHVRITTDGSCIGNPGPGGWACILRFGKHTGELYGYEIQTTNNRMELQAVIQGLRALKEPCEVIVATDSQYVKKGITEWLKIWKLNGWRKANTVKGSRAVLNQDLWQQLDEILGRHKIEWKWVKGHADDPDNLRCDALANQAARAQVSSGGIHRLE